MTLRRATKVDNPVVEQDSNDRTGLGAWAESELDRAEQADDRTRLKVLDELYRALEAEIAQDLSSRR